MLWKANIDIQFVVESSLVLAHCVSIHVTKAEKNSMQEVSENKSSMLNGVYALNSVVNTRLVICCLAIISLRNLLQKSGPTSHVSVSHYLNNH